MGRRLMKLSVCAAQSTQLQHVAAAYGAQDGCRFDYTIEQRALPMRLTNLTAAG